MKKLSSILLLSLACAAPIATAPTSAKADPHWYGETIQHVLVTPLHVRGGISQLAASRIEQTVANSLRQRLPGVRVSARSEMQETWAELYEHTRGCEAPACVMEMARTAGADAVIAGGLNCVEGRCMLMLRWLDARRNIVARTYEEDIGRDEFRHEQGARHAMEMLLAEERPQVAVDSFVPPPPPADAPPPQPVYVEQAPPPPPDPQPVYVEQAPPVYVPPACASGDECYNVGDYMRARELYHIECDRGGGFSCNALAYMHEQGIGVPPNEGEARAFYGRACSMNVGPACNSLAMMFEAGRGGPTDYFAARANYERACDMGTPAGCYLVAVMWERGSGMPNNPVRAREYYNRACNAGEGRGCANLASMHEAGRGGMANREEAMRMYNAACEHGDAESCRRVNRPVPVVQVRQEPPHPGMMSRIEMRRMPPPQPVARPAFAPQNQRPPVAPAPTPVPAHPAPTPAPAPSAVHPTPAPAAPSAVHPTPAQPAKPAGHTGHEHDQPHHP